MSASSVVSAIQPLSQGFLLSVSIIIVPGPQNLFLLQQGLRRHHLFVTALLCTLVDLVLIAVGVKGAGLFVSAHSTLLTTLSMIGALVLVWCGGRSLLAARRGKQDADLSHETLTPTGLSATIAAVLSFSLLNPATYLDTLAIIGTKSIVIPVEHRLIFGLGAVLASAFWFFTLTYGASRLSPLLRHPGTTRFLDGVSGCIMLGIAGTMIAALYLAL